MLRTADRSWPVYATGATGVLGRFVGHRVEVEARVVDPDGSGAEELWVGRLTDLDGDG